MAEDHTGWLVDDFLPPPLRSSLEERYWRPIQARAMLEVLRHDPEFLRDPASHPAMFSDHGVVHVRDIADGLVRLVAALDGLLLPGRPPDRLRFVQAVGVATAYLHDIGMVDLTPAGRRVHPAFAAQAAFDAEMDPLADHLLSAGPVGDRLARVAAEAPFAGSLDVVVRELMSTTVVHSKSAVPAAVLQDRPRLRRLLQQVVFTDLADQRVAARLPDGHGALPPLTGDIAARYRDPGASFAWVTATDGPHAALADDVLDALRALRAADVLRQRGTVLRTSGGYELCIDAETAQAVCTLRSAEDGRTFVVRYHDDRAAGEADIRVAFITPQGHLRIAFHRGRFGSDAAARRAVSSVADVVIDIAADVIPSLGGSPVAGGLRRPTRAASEVCVELERPEDAPAFAEDVAAVVAQQQPSLAARLRVVADVEGAAPLERHRYHAARPVDGTSADAHEAMRRMREYGHELPEVDPADAFAEVRRAMVRAGDVLMERGSRPSFAYVPMGPGLVVQPGGGYPAAPLHAWVPVGTTGIIRGAERNAEVVAEREVEVLVIPAADFAASWLHPMATDELVARLAASAVTS